MIFKIEFEKAYGKVKWFFLADYADDMIFQRCCMLGSVISSLEVVRPLKLMMKLAIASKGKKIKERWPLITNIIQYGGWYVDRHDWEHKGCWRNCGDSLARFLLWITTSKRLRTWTLSAFDQLPGPEINFIKVNYSEAQDEAAQDAKLFGHD